MSEIVEQTRGRSLERLRRSARTLFVDRGYHQTRPQDIARLAGLANGTFYLHFNDKKEAFLDFAAQAQRELLDQLKAALQGVDEHRRRWRVIFEVIAGFATSHPGVLQAAFLDPVVVAPEDEEAWAMYGRMGRFVSLALSDSEQAGQIHDDYDLELISHGLCGMLRYAMVFASRRDMERDRMIDDLSRFIDRGLGFSEGPCSRQEGENT